MHSLPPHTCRRLCEHCLFNSHMCDCACKYFIIHCGDVCRTAAHSIIYYINSGASDRPFSHLIPESERITTINDDFVYSSLSRHTACRFFFFSCRSFFDRSFASHFQSHFVLVSICVCLSVGRRRRRRRCVALCGSGGVAVCQDNMIYINIRTHARTHASHHTRSLALCVLGSIVFISLNINKFTIKRRGPNRSGGR